MNVTASTRGYTCVDVRQTSRFVVASSLRISIASGIASDILPAWNTLMIQQRSFRIELTTLVWRGLILWVWYKVKITSGEVGIFGTRLG